jgi:hypothetical protein
MITIEDQHLAMNQFHQISLMKKYFYSLLILCSVSCSAFAAHPLVTDDTGTQGEGNNQLEVNTDWLHQSGIASHIGAMTYTYGVAENLDVFTNVPTNFYPFAGVGDLSFGAKWRYMEDEGASLAIKPEISIPTGNTDKGIGNGRSSQSLTQIASYATGPWTFHANLGVALNRYAKAENQASYRPVVWRASTAVWYAITPQWRIVADSGVAQNSIRTSNINPSFVLFGAIYSPNEFIDLDIGVKKGLNTAEVNRQLGVGATFHF